MAGSTPAAPGRIFLSYRREETDFPAGWLHDRLAAHFGRDQVFRDVDDIPLGASFPEVIAKAVASCDVLLALIGAQWATITDEQGKRRLDDPNDFVRLEIEAALQRGVLVVPILVRGAKMPPAQQLPASLAELVHRNALELSSTSFDFDTGRLLKVLDQTLAQEQARRDAAKKARRDAAQESRLQPSPAEVDFGTLVHGAASPWRTVQLRHAGPGPLNARVSTEQPWIALQLLGDRIQLRIDTAVPGRLDGEVLVTSDAGDASVPVRALVRPGPILAVEPGLVDFGQVDARAGPVVLVKVTNKGRGELRWSHEPSGSFFRAERVPEGLRLRLDAAPPGQHHGSVALHSNGGDATVDVRAELAPAARTRPRRRAPRSALLAVAAALLLLGGFASWALTRPEAITPGATVPGPTVPGPTVPGSTVPGRLQDAVADFAPGFTTDPSHSGDYTLGTLGHFHRDAPRLRPILEGLGFRRGSARALHSDEGELLSVNVMELGSAQAARAAEAQVGPCRDRPEGNFSVPSIAGATGRRCTTAEGNPVQEVVFTRGPLLYRVKLEKIQDPRSTDRIVELARVQARKAS